MIEEIIAQVERVLRIGLTIITAYLVALWIASIWWTFRDIRSRSTDLFLQVAATLHGMDLEHGLMFNVPELRVTVITVARGAEVMRDGLAARPWITPIVMKGPQDLAGAFRQLRRDGVHYVSCIGGRTLAGQLIDAGLIQDLYLTTSAQSGGEPNTPFHPAPPPTIAIARKHGTGADCGVVFEHLRI